MVSMVITSRARYSISAEPITIEVAEGLSLRVYPDRRPGNLEIAEIHKALILVKGSVELVEEGSWLRTTDSNIQRQDALPGLSDAQDDPM